MFKPHLRICAAAFLIDFAVMGGMMALPFYIYNQIGGTETMSGYIGGVQSICYAIACLVSAPFVSRAKNGLTWAVLGMAGFAVFSCFVPMFKDAFVCGAAATIASVALALVWPALHSWVGAEPDPERRADRMSWFNISWSSGFAVSPLIAGPLYDYDYRLPFLVLFVTCLFVIFLVMSLPHEHAHYAAASPELIEARAGHDRAGEEHLYAAWCATLVGAAVGGVTRTVYPKRVEELVTAGQLRILFEAQPAHFLTTGPATKYSWLAFALAITAAASFLVMGRTRRWQHRFQLLFWLQVAAAVAFWVLGNTRSLVVMMLCFVVVGGASGVCFFASLYYSMVNPARKHRRAAVNEGVVGIGGCVGSIGFGYLAGRYGFAVPFHYTPLFIAAALLVQVFLLRYGAVRQRNATRVS